VILYIDSKMYMDGNNQSALFSYVLFLNTDPSTKGLDLVRKMKHLSIV
jgi:hypothetical protein